MIDPTTCRRINPNYHHDFTHEKGAHGKLASPAVSVEQGEAWGDSASRNGLERKQRTSSAFREQDLLVASPVVLGFDLSEKCWLEFSLAGLQEIEWAEHPLQSVFLPAPTKSDLRFLESLVRSHVPRAHAQALQVKQKGLNIVLHGPPGFGKTMTANALVEHLKRPRYTLRASDLGHSAASIAQALDEAIETTRTWNAILQLDAADMYLEARQAYDTHHNSAVATFLQFMERHRSVLILTTDRLEHFDPSVLGYIHFALHFESPDRKTRRLIWKHHIAQSDRALQRDISEASDLSELDVDMLSKRVLNGRQIAGLVQVARGIADFEESALMPRHFEHVLRSAEHLERDVQGGDSYRDAMRQYF
ncbi:hypothetical protein HBH98_253140 [Parastagonospora nodorum]|nr:hypothetical protein HBH51_255350 [Parastagonospora nodorum]KAH4332766.1 hypothetical protein HBH98_253140 [Parastagonospora nodorum]KAH4354322.1 hypothetical protein HBH97_251260 [Parastagonospora nodorum]KAH4367311.1 hypothetical protein HBH99_252860 [Parastagonospora nodorum]KAH4890672.1 hypothetical protein HBH74_240060 [Parastagonospora nodorum]